MTALLLLLFALFASAVFAGSETAYYGVNPLRLKHATTESRRAYWLERILAPPEAFLGTLLIGNNFANDLIVHAGVLLLVGWGMPHPEFLATLLLTPLVFFCGEAWPKQWMVASPLPRLMLVMPFLLLARLVFLPLSFPLSVISRLFQRGGALPLAGRQHWASLLEEGASSGEGEAQAMQAAATALETRGEGLRMFLRQDVPLIHPDTDLAEAKRLLAQSPDTLAILDLPDTPLLLMGSRLADALPDRPLIELAQPLSVVEGDMDLSALLVRLQASGEERVWVSAPDHWQGLFDLEYALAKLLAPAPRPHS